MASGAVSVVRDILGPGAHVHASLATALQKCGAVGAGTRQWVVLERGDRTADDLQKALAGDQRAQLGIVVIAADGPVGQLEVLRAMECGDVYVAAAELAVGKGDGSGLAAAALRAASAYTEGPAVVLLADPKAVEANEQWTPFTYDPRREPPFIADCPRAQLDTQAFLARENLLTLVAKKSVDQGKEGEAGGAAAGGTLGAKTVTILYTSDTGHAEECGKAIARECRNGGYASSAVRCGTLDSFDVGTLASEPLLVFCVATAGKGELPGNGRLFWGKLSDRAAEMKGTLTSMNYAVFGLGDSHYWGKGTEDSKVNFAKPARDLDELLESLGGQRFLPIGFGDDQDVDQYHTGFGEWKGQLYSRLGMDKAGGGGGGDDGPVKKDQVIKAESQQLRGSLRQTLDDITSGQMPFEDTRLIRFHGSFQQDDRDLREERQKLGIEFAFSFTIRVGLPGGYCTAEQWLAMDDICRRYADGMLRITTGQTWQLHGVLKRDLKSAMRGINRACLDTVAAGGDVCRNVLCTSNPSVCSRELMDQIVGYACAIHDHCLPRSRAYHEVFLMHGDEMAEKSQVMCSSPIEEEPLYGLTYLPYKFTVAVAIPPSNDVDVFAHSCGFIAIIEGEKLQGFNVTVGRGLGSKHSNQKTGNIIGFCRPESAKYVCEAALTVERDFGDRTGRDSASFKYTIETYGPGWYRQQVENRLGRKLEPARPYRLEGRGDFFGWAKTDDGLWHCGCFVPLGRVKGGVRDGFAKIAEELRGCGAFRMTCDQSVLITEVPEEKKACVERLLVEHEVVHSEEAAASFPRGERKAEAEAADGGAASETESTCSSSRA